MSEADESSRISILPSDSGPKHWREALLAVGAGLVVLMTLLLVPIPFDHRWSGAVGDLFHAPLFGTLTYGILSLLDRRLPTLGWPTRYWLRLVLVALAAFSFGVAAEIFQSLSGRSAAWHDVVANGLGIVAAVTWYIHRRLQSLADTDATRRVSKTLVFIAGAILIAAWWNPIVVLIDVVMVHVRFPMISSFETEMQRKCWYFRNSRGVLTDNHVTDGKYSLEMTAQPEPLTGCTCYEMHGNWSTMHSLKIDVRLSEDHPHPTALLTVQIVDYRTEIHDEGSFQYSLELPRGRWKTVEILRSDIVDESGRPTVDLSRIRYLDLFFLAPPVPTKVTIDNVRIVQQ